MTKAELIKALEQFPDNLEVRTVQSASCCCGDCFLPQDGESGVWDVVEMGAYKKSPAYILIG